MWWSACISPKTGCGVTVLWCLKITCKDETVNGCIWFHITECKILLQYPSICDLKLSNFKIVDIIIELS